MSIYDLYETRHHVLEYSAEPVDDSLLNTLLWKAWKMTPSKSNAMAYTVSVIGPKNQVEKNKIYEQVEANHLFYDEIGFDYNTKDNPELSINYKFKSNPFYAHVKNNSHLLVFSSRLAKPNAFYRKTIRDEGHFFEQAEEDQVPKIAESVSIECGFFATHLAGLCREQNIDVSYCSCVSKSLKKWRSTPYLWYNHEKKLARVHLVMSIGYAEKYRYEWLIENRRTKDDIKPKFTEVVKFIK